MHNIDRPIAIIDSGIGGVSVLRQLIKQYGAGNYIYYADNAFMPYGNKTQQEIESRLTKIFQMLFNDYGVHKIIVACNTASTCLSSSLKDVITLKFSKDLIYLATPLTQKNLPNHNVVASDTLAKLIEGNIFNYKTLRKAVKEVVKINHLTKYNKIILACTHYELINNIFKEVCNDTEIINNSEIMIKNLDLNIETDELNVVVLQSKKDYSQVETILKLLKH